MHFEEGKSDCTSFSKGKALCQERPAVRQQVNEITSFVDASGIYGNTEQVAKRLRRMDGKKYFEIFLIKFSRSESKFKE